MLETLSVRPRICDQIRSGPLGRWVDDFVDVLMTRGYATGTVRACRRMSSATLPRCTCSRPASTWRPSRCGSATSDSKPPINTSRRTCNSRKTLCENSSRSVNERSGSRPTPRCWPSWRASDYDKQTTWRASDYDKQCWTPTATVSPTVTCHNAMLVILTGMTSWSYLSVPRARQQRLPGRLRRARRRWRLRPRSGPRKAAEWRRILSGSRCPTCGDLAPVLDFRPADERKRPRRARCGRCRRHWRLNPWGGPRVEVACGLAPAPQPGHAAEIDMDLPTSRRRSLSFAAWHAWDAARLFPSVSFTLDSSHAPRTGTRQPWSPSARQAVRDEYRGLCARPAGRDLCRTRYVVLRGSCREMTGYSLAGRWFHPTLLDRRCRRARQRSGGGETSICFDLKELDDTRNRNALRFLRT